MVPSDEEIRAAIADQAGEWFVANQAGPLSDADRGAFFAWLKASPIHLQEYLGVARTVYQLKAAAADPRVPLRSFLTQTRNARNDVVTLESATPRGQEFRSRPVTLWLRPLAASTLALIVLATGALWWMHDAEHLSIAKTYQTAHGEEITQQLPDGSVLHLDTDSAVTVLYSGRERLVEVSYGRALFQVAPDNRPFRVAAGLAGITATAADFEVKRRTSATTVTVAKGEVAVFTGQPSFLHADNGASKAVQRVTAGYQTQVGSAGLASEPVAVPDAKSLVDSPPPEYRDESRALQKPDAH